MRASERRRSIPVQPCTLYVATRSFSPDGAVFVTFACRPRYLHLRPEDRHGSTFDFFLPRSVSPILERNFMRITSVLLKNFYVGGNELPVEHVEVRLFVQ